MNSRYYLIPSAKGKIGSVSATLSRSIKAHVSFLRVSSYLHRIIKPQTKSEDLVREKEVIMKKYGFSILRLLHKLFATTLITLVLSILSDFFIFNLLLIIHTK